VFERSGGAEVAGPPPPVVGPVGGIRWGRRGVDPVGGLEPFGDAGRRTVPNRRFFDPVDREKSAGSRDRGADGRRL
jgi:hypothetical protein